MQLRLWLHAFHGPTNSLLDYEFLAFARDPVVVFDFLKFVDLLLLELLGSLF